MDNPGGIADGSPGSRPHRGRTPRVCIGSCAFDPGRHARQVKEKSVQQRLNFTPLRSSSATNSASIDVKFVAYARGAEWIMMGPRTLKSTGTKNIDLNLRESTVF